MTGLIYVVIIALWAAVLIPIWLRRHDQISEVRSTARFSSAMRSLSGPGQRLATDPSFAADTAILARPGSGRPAPHDRSSHHRPSREEARAMRTTPTTRPGSDVRTEGLDPSYERELARQAASTRRAIVLGVLSLVLLGALVLAIAGVLPQWSPLVAALPVLAFVLAAALTKSQRTPAARPASRSADRRATRGAEATVDSDAPAPAVQSDDDWENWNAWDDDDSWDAVPTTLPTYVTAPRASAVPRGIDRSRPGEWTGEAMVETARSLRRRDGGTLAQPPAAGHADETTEIPAVRDPYDGRRAVNG